MLGLTILTVRYKKIVKKTYNNNKMIYNKILTKKLLMELKKIWKQEKK